MAQGGFCKLPSGAVVVALTLPAPPALAAKSAGAVGASPWGSLSRPAGSAGAAGSGGAPKAWEGPAGGTSHEHTAPADRCGDTGTVRVLVHAANRARALTRLRNLGLRAVYLRGNSHPPTPDEITAVLHHPDGLIWRTAPLRPDELWHPIRSLFAGPQTAARSGAEASGGSTVAGAVLGSGSELNATVAARFVPQPLTVPEAWTASGA